MKLIDEAKALLANPTAEPHEIEPVFKRLIAAVELERGRAERLWELLDNIDTQDDACRDNDAAFRRAARRQMKLRGAFLESDGYVLWAPDEDPPARPHDAPVPAGWERHPYEVEGAALPYFYRRTYGRVTAYVWRPPSLGSATDWVWDVSPDPERRCGQGSLQDCFAQAHARAQVLQVDPPKQPA